MYALAITELQHQPPPTCPANHVPRVELLKEISSAILNSDITPTIGTTVTIRGIGGIGKSTIAKALCHDPLIKEHFINGFLWISLAPPLPNPMTMLSDIYQRLTDKSAAASNVSIIISKIKSLVSNPSCKLLVILDDVWEAKDAMMFVDVFSSCKTVMTTRKMNINAKIPPVMCFDVKPMSIEEAVKLLTLQIVEVEKLKTTDSNKIQELARDLHCWPLLLNLVHGQLYVHCIEWNESPQDAISKVQQKLFDNGLTAFDPENQNDASRQNAVRASITASLELLSNSEGIILFYIASSIIGFGVYTFNNLLSTVLQMEAKQFDKCINNLWCHGLIAFQDIIIPNLINKIPCIGVHEVIAQYINENLPDKFYLSVTGRIVEVFHDMFFHEYFDTAVVTNIGQLFLSQGDAIKIPFFIRFLIIQTKFAQIVYYHKLNELVRQHFQLQQHSTLKHLIHNSQFPQVKHMYKTIEQDCKRIHLLLTDGNYNEVITWAEQYFHNHPYKLTLQTIISNFKNLLDSCKGSFNNEVILAIEGCISHFNQSLILFSSWRRITTLLMVGYIHVMHLLNAAASDDDIKHYLICSMLYMNTRKYT